MNYSENIHRLILFFHTSVDVGYLILFKNKNGTLGRSTVFSHRASETFVHYIVQILLSIIQLKKNCVVSRPSAHGLMFTNNERMNTRPYRVMYFSSNVSPIVCHRPT